MKNINDEFAKYCQNKSGYSLMERTIFEAYRECVLQNDNTIGKRKLVFSLTQKFEDILNMITL